RPGIEEDRHLPRARLLQRARVVVFQERQREGRRGGGRGGACRTADERKGEQGGAQLHGITLASGRIHLGPRAAEGSVSASRLGLMRVALLEVAAVDDGVGAKGGDVGRE